MTYTFCCGRKVVHIQAVGDEELEEYIEVDGVVCDNDIEGDVVLHSNEVVVSSEMQDGVFSFCKLLCGFIRPVHSVLS